MVETGYVIDSRGGEAPRRTDDMRDVKLSPVAGKTIHIEWTRSQLTRYVERTVVMGFAKRSRKSVRM